MRAQASYTIVHVKDGNDLDGILMLWKKTTTNTAPAKPSGTNLNGWTEDMPEFESGAYVWTCNRVVISDPTAATPIYIYTDPVLDTHWQKLDDLSTKYTEIKSTADEAYMKAGKNGQDIAVLKLTTNGLSSTVEGQGQKLTNIEQTVNNITLTVVNPDGEETSIKLSDGKLDMTGFVTFTDLSTQGKTTINGSNITTGAINASLITTGTLNADLLKAGTINGVAYFSREPNNSNNYLEIYSSLLHTRKIGTGITGYPVYHDVYVLPGRISCEYGDIEQTQYIIDYEYDGIRFYGSESEASRSDLKASITLNNYEYLKIRGQSQPVMWVDGRDGALLRSTNSPNTAQWTPLTSVKTTNGSWEMGGYGDELTFSYATDANYNAGNNTTQRVFMTPSGDFYLKGKGLGIARVLWSGTAGMGTSQTVYLDEAVSSQLNGIILVFSEYDPVNNTAYDAIMCPFYIPKYLVAQHHGAGFNFPMKSFWYECYKYCYIADTYISGNVNNWDSEGSKRGTLRYVLGV